MSIESRRSSPAAGVPVEHLRGLHELLRGAAVDGFAEVMAEGLGGKLREVADSILAGGSVGAPWDEQLRHFRGGLDRFEERGQHDRSRVVAHGLRIVAAVRASAPRAPERRAVNRDLGPARPGAREARGRVPSRARVGRGAAGSVEEASAGGSGAEATGSTSEKAAKKATAAKKTAAKKTATKKTAAKKTAAKKTATKKTATKKTAAKKTAAKKTAAKKTATKKTAAKKTAAKKTATKKIAEGDDGHLLTGAEMSLAERLAAAAERLTSLPGIGRKTAEKLVARGIESVEDLAFLLPKRYEDRRRKRRLDEVVDGEFAVVEATIRSFRQGYFRGRFLATLEVEQEREEGPPLTLKARWFHRVGGLPQRIETGKQICLIGAIKWFRGECSMVHPEARDPDDPGPSIAVRYPDVEGIGQGSLARYCRGALARLREEGFVDALPEELAREHGLPGQLEALERLHLPPEGATDEEVRALQGGSSAAHRRLAFDEFFFLQLALLRRRQEWCGSPVSIAPLPEAVGDRERLRACIPFEPTGAQWRSISEIEQDMTSGRPMLRLLQGDVGAGKTVVAFAACLGIIAAGGQAAIMAPTEILAEQHLRTLTGWCKAAGVRIALLTGATRRASRATTLALLAAGELDLVVGTHALIVEDVIFRQLGLVVIDEQHRFGVEQRALLRDKGLAPHLLVMTATPIPRSLALTAYGELDVSLLDEMPPGRIAPETVLHSGKSGLDRARLNLTRRIAAGLQGFVVCPLVEASEAIDVTHVEETAAALREMVPGVEVAVIHGRMISRDKEAVMDRFRAGEVRILVATTVIEVGVDVPGARVILIEHAERFGLAQLHQLRGRVGRGQEASWCVLHTAASRNSESAERLKVMVDTCDGFQVAERDLELRGPGEIFGTRQAGVPRLRYYGFAGEGLHLLVAARNAAQRLLDGDPELTEHPQVGRELNRRLAVQAVYSADAG